MNDSKDLFELEEQTQHSPKEVALDKITLQLLHYAREQKGKDINMIDACAALQTKRNRLQIVMCIFKAIGICHYRSKNTYKWNGAAGLRRVCNLLKEKDEESKHLKTATRAMVYSFMNSGEDTTKIIRGARKKSDIVSVLCVIGLVKKVKVGRKNACVWNFDCPFLYDNKEFF